MEELSVMGHHSVHEEVGKVPLFQAVVESMEG